MIELFQPWIALQQQAIDFSARQLAGAQALVAASQATQAAMEANVKAAESWLSLWGFRR